MRKSIVMWLFLCYQMTHCDLTENEHRGQIHRRTFSEKNSIENELTSDPDQNRNRTGKLYFDEIFGINLGDITDGDEKDRLGNCTCQCGVTNQEVRIVGGRPTGVNKYPWVARLVYDGNFHCGASLINEDYVLTAAHCVRRLKRSKIRIVLGDYDQSVTTETAEPTMMRAVSSIVRHRHFDVNNYNHDIALLKLRKPVSFTKSVRPICLPPDNIDPSGKMGTVVGWGRTSEGGSLATEALEVQVPILSPGQCRAMKYKPSRITPNMLCAGRGEMDSCQGDSGGPLIINDVGRYELVGIVSWGVGCGRPGYPGVYTRVNRYLSWVKRNMKDTCLCVS
ncbi:trypsin-1-like [Diaphorina citri]|uniref:Trypsin-1-like n=1 Tax=Diaphorina citri TaxID=121845 RepID=A0A3Q0IU66_DIACI|nr:trypsin-1-like [Diaphorina citri]KAI5750360.1 hypothetical protein M8J76_015051 [Diaphorina citri]KAI5753703.1 hypothetical protein M8J77_002597 [Diaphorina citri]